MVRVINSGGIVGKSEHYVYEVLGNPDFTNHYARLSVFAPGIDENRTQVLMFYLDGTNQITAVSSSVEQNEKPFSKEEWKAASGAERARMMPDFVEKWNQGKEPEIRTYDDIVVMFQGCQYVCEMKYVIDWTSSLIVRVDTNGVVVASNVTSN